MSNVKIGYQLYSARWQAAADLPGTLRAIADMGYDGIELAGLYDGRTAQQFRAELDKVGLPAISAHVPYQDMCADIYKTVSDYLALGCRYVAVPYAVEEMRAGNPGFASFIAGLHRFGGIFREAGIQLMYHNHDFEFDRISGMYALDFIYSAVPAAILQSEIDTCWVHYAGEDPAAYVRKYAGRCPIVHLKDYVGRKGGASPYGLIGQAENTEAPVEFEFRPFGCGVQDARSVVTAALDSGAEWLVVELDQTPSGDPFADAAQSIETVRKYI